MTFFTKIIYSLCICLCFISCPCTSHQAKEQGDKVVEHKELVMPRKRKVNGNAMVKDYGKTDVEFEPILNKQDVASSGNIETKEINAKKTNQEELDEAIEAEYFTMDYKPYRKRRPIHNKSQPSAEASP